MFPSFPPADDLFRFLKAQDWNAHYNSFMETVVTVCAFMAAIYTVARDKWIQYDCTQRCINGWNLVIQAATIIVNYIQVAYTFTRETIIPSVIEAYQSARVIYTYLAGHWLEV